MKERAVEPQAPASLSVDAGDVPKPSPRAHSRQPHSSSVDRSNVTVNEKVPPSPRPRTLNPLATAPQFEENKMDMSEVGPEEEPGPSVLYRQTKETSPTEQTDEIEVCILENFILPSKISRCFGISTEFPLAFLLT